MASAAVSGETPAASRPLMRQPLARAAMPF
jgi:hypothetical protein